MRINNIMTNNVIKAQGDMPAHNLLSIIEKYGFHHIPVVDENDQILGIISDRDVSKHVSPFLGTEHEREQDKESLKVTAASIMSANPVTISENSRIKTASILLLENKISCLPVIDDNDGKMVGIITWKDILNYYVYEHPDPVLP